MPDLDLPGVIASSTKRMRGFSAGSFAGAVQLHGMRDKDAPQLRDFVPVDAQLGGIAMRPC